MSRRCHHGSPRHARPGSRERRRGPTVAERPSTPPSDAAGRLPAEQAPPRVDDTPPGASTDDAIDVVEVDVQAVANTALESPVVKPGASRAARTAAGPRGHVADAPGRAPGAPATGPAEGVLDHGATAPQLRRFIKSRAYVPMHELRRRFGINGGEDDVTVLDVEERRVYVGLPQREGRLLGELLRGGDVGVELSLDPIAPIVVGVYPIRPIPRT